MAQFIENNQLVLSFANFMSEKTKNGEPYKSNSVLQYIGRVMETAKHQFYTINRYDHFTKQKLVQEDDASSRKTMGTKSYR